MRDALPLLGAVVANLAGMSWLALSLDVHWRQVSGHSPARHPFAIRLRILGALTLACSFMLCLSVDHTSMASLVWVMALTAAALAVAFTLTWRAHWLRLLILRLPRTVRRTQS